MGIDGPLRFFFYGTLIGGGPPQVLAASAKLRDLGPAQVPGLLHAIPDPGGWYPALVEGEGTVAGRLYEASAQFGAADLAALDAYEEFAPADPAGSLYRRIPLDAGVQVYRYNRNLPEAAVQIECGDFLAWLSERGLIAFSG